MKILAAAAALNQTPLDWDGNLARILAAIAEARAQGVSLLCLPELCLTGYGCEDAFLGIGPLRQAERMLGEVQAATAGMVVAVGLPVLVRHGRFDAVALLADQRLVAVAAKRHLAGDGLHYEPRWFKPWPAGAVVEINLAGQSIPMGDLIAEVGGVRLGFEVCEDAWVADRPGADLARRGVDVILNPSASHFAFGKRDIRRRFVVEGSRAFGVAYVYANLVGNEAGRALYDGHCLIANGGRILAEGPRFSLADHHLTTALIDIAALRLQHARQASQGLDLSDRRGVVAGFAWPATPSTPRQPAPAAWEDGPHLKEEEFTRAVTMGLWDYLRKSRSGGFVVSLSGGCDSAAVTCLSALAVRRAVTELGLPEVRARLPHLDLAQVPDGPALVTRLLTTLYQGTANSSATTRNAAAGVAQAVGARHHEFAIQPLVDAYVSHATNAMGRSLDWQRDDLALQNIQARVRGPTGWLLANLEGKLLLTTSNRSEAAAGYATMDGDTCGGLAPIAGIDKAYLRRWLAWLEKSGPEPHGPLPALAAVTTQASTPELRPAAARQVSEEDLMPFPVLDAIERLAIRDQLPPAEVVQALIDERLDTDPARIRAWVRRFFTLFARNQWKRERFAPAFHLDDENLDPKTWCRFPILSGGFAQELRELE